MNNNYTIKEFEVLNKIIENYFSLKLHLAKQKSNMHTACHHKRNIVSQPDNKNLSRMVNQCCLVKDKTKRK